MMQPTHLLTRTIPRLLLARQASAYLSITPNLNKACAGREATIDIPDVIITKSNEEINEDVLVAVVEYKKHVLDECADLTRQRARNQLGRYLERAYTKRHLKDFRGFLVLGSDTEIWSVDQAGNASRMYTRKTSDCFLATYYNVDGGGNHIGDFWKLADRAWAFPLPAHKVVDVKGVVQFIPGSSIQLNGYVRTTVKS